MAGISADRGRLALFSIYATPASLPILATASRRLLLPYFEPGRKNPGPFAISPYSMDAEPDKF
jgi:hypothetical protein